MRKPLQCGAAWLVFTFFFATTAWAQNATLQGTVTDGSDNLPLSGANVVLTLDGSTNMAGGSATGVDGRYVITGLSAGTYNVSITFIGYQEYSGSVTLSATGSETLDVTLQPGGFDLNTVVVTASRQQEKALDAPASLSVLGAEEIMQDASTSAVSALRNTTGVDMAQTGIDRREIVLRGFNNAFSGATYTLVDYRQAAAPALAVNMYSSMPITTVDIERIEVVRGPGSALYGAGVDAGVVHFITKDPFTSPGTTLSLSLGERSTAGFQFRHASVINNNFGFKVVGEYLTARDWEMNPEDPEDGRQLQNDQAVRDNDYLKYKINGELQYRFNDKVSLIANAGTSSLKATVLSGIGTLQADGFGYSYGQLRLQAGNFFAQGYLNVNDAGDSFVYGQDFDGDNRPDPVVDKGQLVNLQAQYDFAVWEDKQQFIVGVDFESITPDTEGTINGRNEDDDQITETGGYVQSTTNLTSQLDLTLALRGDYNNIVEEFRVSPRAAVVFKVDNNNTFRATYNRAFSSPGSNSNFLDIVARAPDAALPVTIRGRGSAFGYTFQRNPAFAAIAGSDLVASSLNPASLGADQPVGLPLDATYASVYNGIAGLGVPTLTAILQQQGLQVDAQTTGFLLQQLDPSNTQVQGFSRGALALLNPTTQEFSPIQDVTDVSPLEQTTSQTIEVGYKGIVSDRLLIAVDAYYTTKENFIGPLLMETPFVFVPSLQTDLTAAYADAIANNPVLAGALGQLGLTPGAVAGLVVGLAADQLPTATTPVAIVQPTENNGGAGSAPELLLAYRNFGKVEYFGADISAQFIVNDQLNVFGNVSFVNDDFFDNEELDETDTDLALALNAPTFKGKLGGSYALNNGVSLSASGRYTEGFPVRSGPYVGDVDSFFLLDLSAGYDVPDVPGLRADLSISNVLNNEHRQFVGAPQLGRLGMMRVTYSF